ncbi:MAG: ftsY [Dehalococcoidia bacterium]|nr:ftsY [Dehalococcoidia bacterium]
MFSWFRKDKTEQAVKPSREAWFGKVMRLFDRPSLSDELWEELEEVLIAADVGMKTTAELIGRVRQRAKAEKAAQPASVRELLKEEMVALLTVTGGAPDRQPGRVPWIILVVGVNGSGKTTSIAKLAYSFQQSGKKVLLAAADTFRAAAIDQLKVWGERAGVEVVAHQPGADPGAVVFDALEAAASRQVDVVLIDTAGRLHTRVNLMEELKKVKRVASRKDVTAPHEVLLVLDATTGQNGLVQAKHFTEAAGVTGIVLAKLDGTAKGGIVLAISAELKLPILYIGTGEKLDDIAPFDARAFVEALCG